MKENLIKGSEIVCKALINEGVDTVFGIPGGAILPLYGTLNKFPEIKGPVKEDICYATTNRQAAVKKIAPNCEMFFVIGSRNSSNSARLVEVAKKSGCKNSELIFYGKNAPLEKIKSCKIIGLSSGASAPEELVQNFISEIKNDMDVSIEEVVTANEKVVFKLPKELN